MTEPEKKPSALAQLKERVVTLRQAQIQDQAAVMAMTEEFTSREAAMETVRRRIDRRSGAIQQLNEVLELLEQQTNEGNSEEKPDEKGPPHEA